VHMGARLNESHDALPLLPLLQHLVERYYPEYGPLWREETVDDRLVALLAAAFPAHLDGGPAGPGRPWGWKLCETSHILPVVDFLCPGARYLHLVRDGRDVAFSDFDAPNTVFRRKLYFNTDRLERWEGRGLRRKDYRRCSDVFNAQLWVNCVTIGRAFGSMLRERYREVRYEALCLRFEEVGGDALRWAGAPRVAEAIAALRPEVRSDRVGKFARQSWWKRRRVLRIVEPTLKAMGYD
jgi:hypothetical protein